MIFLDLFLQNFFANLDFYFDLEPYHIHDLELSISITFNKSAFQSLFFIQ